MTDLINKINEIEMEKINELQVKYASFVDVIDNKKQYLPIIYTIDIAIKYVKEIYKDIDIDLAGWTIVAIKRLLEKEVLINEEEITKEVDNFISHYTNNFQLFINDIAICSNDYDKECGFIGEYVHKRKLGEI